MKRTSQIIAMLLTFVMVFTMTGIQTFAESKSLDLTRFKEGSGYIAFGDSIARGFGTTATETSQGYDENTAIETTDNPNCRNVEGSYPWLLAQSFGCTCNNSLNFAEDNYWPIAQNAATTTFIMNLLGVKPKIEDTEFITRNYMQTRYKTFLHYFGDENSIPSVDGTTGSASTRSITELIHNSSLITIGLGMGDVWNRAKVIAFPDEFPDLSDTEAVVNLLKNFAEKMYEGYEQWKANYPLLLEYLKKNAPNATIVLVGSNNPAFNINISEDYLYPIGTAFSTISSLMNKQYKKWAKKYGCLYVDITNVETGSTEKEVSIMDLMASGDRTQGLATHPTRRGYKQIAKLITKALENEGTYILYDTDIKVNLGRVKVDEKSNIRVNGMKVNKERVKVTSDEDGEQTLIVSCLTPLAKTLSVTTATDKNTMEVSVYNVAYTHGYDTYRVYTADDFGKVVKSAIKNIKDIPKTIASLVKGLL